MSDGQKNQNPTGEQDPNNEPEIKDPKAVLDKNRELLGKNKNLSTQNKELQDKLAQIEQEKLSAEGKKDELIESLKKKVSDLESNTKNLGWNMVSSQIAVEAAKRGCVNTNTLMKVIDFQNASINTDDFSIAQDDVKTILDNAMKDHEYLFKKNVTPPKDGGVGNSTPTVDLKKMTTEQLKDEYRKLNK